MPESDSSVRVVDNPDRNRYEAYVGDELAGFVTYRARPGVVVLVHTEVDDAFEGRRGGRAPGRRSARRPPGPGRQGRGMVSVHRPATFNAIPRFPTWWRDWAPAPDPAVIGPGLDRRGRGP